MSVVSQIAAGSFLLVLCTIIHLWVVSRVLTIFRERSTDTAGKQPMVDFFWLCFAVLAALFSHTGQVYLWSFALLQIGALRGYEASIYFVLVSYTTLGYGDIILNPQFRILGAMSSVTGIIMFGITTAFLVAVLGRGFLRN
ncbi:ion channel [Roseovarius sp. D22-M7]|uniref:ion channel n=1 Tax=Roseovarius sp. D22-M7 TaxID=3127116 RepID=UPI00300F8871